MAPWVDDSLFFEALTHLLKLPKNCAQAGTDIKGLDGDAGPCCPEIELADNGDPTPEMLAVPSVRVSQRCPFLTWGRDTVASSRKRGAKPRSSKLPIDLFSSPTE